MQTIFLELLKLSLIGSLFTAAVMLVRLVFRKAPKWLFCVLWGVVALRLICPFSIESSISLVPDRLASGQIIASAGSEYIGDVEMIYESNDAYSNAVDAGRQPIYSNSGYYVITEKDSLEAPKTVGNTVYPILSWVWLAGMVLMLTYTAVSYLILRKKMAEATHLRNNIWQCEQVGSPFVLGFLKPRIYLPYAISDSDISHVIAHEQAHIGRKDHWWKPLGFLLLSIHWFNPVLWLAYILLCRDIEAACDEKVIKHMEKDEMRAYSTALLNCSVHRRRIAACPLAFGEVGVKERIKRIMHYKKPAFWIIVAVLLVCTVVAVCFITIPGTSPEWKMSGSNIADMDVEAVVARIHKVEGLKNSNVYMNANNFSLTVDTKFNWVDSQAVRYFFYKGQEIHSAQLRIFPDENKYYITESSEWIDQEQIFLLQHYLNAVRYLPQDALRQISPADRYLISHVEDGVPHQFDRVISYSSAGVGETDGWFIHLRVEPLHADGESYHGIGDDVVHLFYGDSNGQSVDTNKLLSLVSKIANNPDCAASSNPFTFIEARQTTYNEILTYGSSAVDFFVEQLRTGENGLHGYIMAVACADITGIGDKNAGGNWATAQEWLALYDKSHKNTIIPPVIATDYISDQQARLLSFGYTCDKPGQSAIACGIAPWQGDYCENNTLVLDGKKGQNQILLTPKGFSLSHYRIYLPDGTVYDDGTRKAYDSLSRRVMNSEKGICLIAPFQTGEYIYEVELSWPEEEITVTYGLKVVMTGNENDYDRALQSVFAAYGEGNPLIAVSLVDKYTLANAVYSSARYVFKVENVPNAPIWVEVSRDSAEIMGEFKYYETIRVDPPYLDETWNIFDSGPVETIKGSLKTYYRNTDGTWQVDGWNYQYRLEVTGRIDNATVDSTFVYLSNIEKITFDQAWKAAGFSSNSADYFSVEDAVLVDWINGDTGSIGGTEGPATIAMTLADVLELSKLGMELTWEDLTGFEGHDIGSGLYVVQYDIDPEFYLLVGDGKATGAPMYAYLNARSSGAGCDIRTDDVRGFILEQKAEALDYAIYKAIITHNADGTFPDYPSGLVPTESHRIFAVETKSRTPFENLSIHMEETTVYLLYAYTRYYHSEGNLELRAIVCTPAAITFSVDPEQGYVVKEFWEPNPGSTFQKDVQNKFPEEAAKAILDTRTDGYYANDLQSKCLSKVVYYLAEVSGELASVGTPVAWIDEMDSVGTSFRFQFDIPYTKIEASCDNGKLIDADSTGNKEIGTTLTIGEGKALYWSPQTKDGFHEATTITFSLFAGSTEIYSGSIVITGRNYDNSDVFAYIATLNSLGLRMDLNGDAVGAVILPVDE